VFLLPAQWEVYNSLIITINFNNGKVQILICPVCVFAEDFWKPVYIARRYGYIKRADRAVPEDLADMIYAPSDYMLIREAKWNPSRIYAFNISL
jgi:hypothetical protein